MHVLGLLDDVDDLGEEDVEFAGVPVLVASVEDEADSFEAFDPLLVLLGLGAEVGAVEGDFLQVVQVGLAVLVQRYHPVHNVGPVPESWSAADEEVVLVEYLQQLRTQLPDEQHPRLLKEVVDDFRGTFREDQVGCTFVLNKLEQNFHPFAGPPHHPVVLLGQVRILQQLEAQLL